MCVLLTFTCCFHVVRGKYASEKAASRSTAAFSKFRGVSIEFRLEKFCINIISEGGGKNRTSGKHIERFKNWFVVQLTPPRTRRMGKNKLYRELTGAITITFVLRVRRSIRMNGGFSGASLTPRNLRPRQSQAPLGDFVEALHGIPESASSPSISSRRTESRLFVPLRHFNRVTRRVRAVRSGSRYRLRISSRDIFLGSCRLRTAALCSLCSNRPSSAAPTSPKHDEGSCPLGFLAYDARRS